MTSLKTYYLSLDRNSRLGLLAGVAAIVLGTAFALWWLLSSKQQLLFGNLREADAAEIVESLNEWKIPHSFTDDGSGILVDDKNVHDTRMRLVSAGVPRGGHVGFELFDDNDFGVTEFAQRINYQRALQGEIERTIAAMPGVSDVRVHLAIKRPGLFLSRQEESKASVALNLSPGTVLTNKQIGGIKSLVAAAVEGLSPDAVVVIGPAGMQLAGGSSESGQDLSDQQDESARLATKLEQRVNELLVNALGGHEATVSIDVRLNFDRVRKTSERLLAQPGSDHGLITKRQSTAARPTETSAPAGMLDEQVEYAHGTEKEEVTRASGTIERLSVAVLLPRPLGAAEIEHLRRLIGASVGFDFARGDRLEIAVAPSAQGGVAVESVTGNQSARAGSYAGVGVLGRTDWRLWSVAGLVVGLLFGLVIAWLLRRPRKTLTQQESEAIAVRIRAWLGEEQGTP